MEHPIGSWMLGCLIAVLGWNRIAVDAGGGSIEGRELAMATLQRMGQIDSQIEGMLRAKSDHATAIRLRRVQIIRQRGGIEPVAR